MGYPGLREIETSDPGVFSVSTEQTGSCVVVVLGGEIDLLSVPRAQVAVGLALRDARNRSAVLIVDLSQVTFFGCPGFRVLLEAVEAAARVGVQLRVIVSTRMLVRLLRISELDRVLAVFPTRDLALSAG